MNEIYGILITKALLYALLLGYAWTAWKGIHWAWEFNWWQFLAWTLPIYWIGRNLATYDHNGLILLEGFFYILTIAFSASYVIHGCVNLLVYQSWERPYRG